MDYLKRPRIRAFLLAVLLAVTPFPLLAQDRPAADAVVDQAVAEARATDRVVMVRFRASWCQWCARLDAAVHSFDLGRMLGDHYVQVELTVDEDETKAFLDTPRAAEYRQALGGAESGIPFYVFLDGDGEVIADSLRMPEGGNIGYPVTDEEIDRFMELVERTAPRMPETDRERVRNYIEARAAEIL
jgi:thioredoxin-related protein